MRNIRAPKEHDIQGGMPATFCLFFTSTLVPILGSFEYVCLYDFEVTSQMIFDHFAGAPSGSVASTLPKKRATTQT